jgi:cytochrome c oxidase cbb3-type subunit III
MTATPGHDRDDVTGFATTGHEWDGIRELDRPLPQWWLWVFYACILYAIGYWIAYPAWPTPTGYTLGLLGYSQRQVVGSEMAAARAAQSKYVDAIAVKPIEDIRKDPELLAFALAGGKSAFGDNCAACHGRGAEGKTGYPNLDDDDWLWGGKLEDIEFTITHGVRGQAKETRQNQMPRFGLDKILEPAQINHVAEFVLSLSGRSTDPVAVVRGKAMFKDQCAACHGDDAKGKLDMGAPIWLYGSTKRDILTSIEIGRGGMMPTWDGRLSPATIKQLALYVHELGGGK